MKHYNPIIEWLEKYGANSVCIVFIICCIIWFYNYEPAPICYDVHTEWVTLSNKHISRESINLNGAIEEKYYFLLSNDTIIDVTMKEYMATNIDDSLIYSYPIYYDCKDK